MGGEEEEEEVEVMEEEERRKGSIWVPAARLSRGSRLWRRCSV